MRRARGKEKMGEEWMKRESERGKEWGECERGEKGESRGIGDGVGEGKGKG